MATKRTNVGDGLCTPKVRRAIYRRDGWRCIYCRAHRNQGAFLSLDHILAHNLGGGDEVTNLVTACKPCNSSKQDLTLDAWLRKLEFEGYSRRRIAGIRRRLATFPARPLEDDP